MQIADNEEMTSNLTAWVILDEYASLHLICHCSVSVVEGCNSVLTCELLNYFHSTVH